MTRHHQPLALGLRHVAADGMRPGGWTDGHPWRDPSPHRDPMLLSVLGRRTRPEPCAQCRGGTVQEFEDGGAHCTRCDWRVPCEP